jgi:hypothetical protein
MWDGDTRKHWDKLCDQTATEEDPEKFLEIFRAIIVMLHERASRLFKQSEKEQSGSKPN